MRIERIKSVIRMAYDLRSHLHGGYDVDALIGLVERQAKRFKTDDAAIDFVVDMMKAAEKSAGYASR